MPFSLPVLLTAALLIFSVTKATSQYNTLWIPDTISGTQFNLTIKDTFAQLRPGNQTITAAVNNAKFWGPTLIFNQGDTVHLTVKNKLNDSTTIHWHGMHLPAVMDGGPHQVIPPGTVWQPYWKVTNHAATYWYHPHLHNMTMEHITKGIGGFIIVRDPQEAALALPRTYGVDDIPLMLTSRGYDASNAFTLTNNQNISEYGDYLLTNGTSNAQVSLPKQYVRLRILNGEIERGYNLGFSDNRTFYIIGNDGGLLNAPVAVTRVKLMVGERVEIMVNLGTDAVGASLDLKSFNSGQPFGFPGGEAITHGLNGSLLNNIDFPVLHINVAATTANPITAVPATLANNTYWTAADATVSRTLNVTPGSGVGLSEFYFDNTPFVFNTINKNVDLNAVEKWTIVNNNVFSHAFHIHDVQFKIVSRSSGSVGNYESGWKDVVYVPRGETVSFVAKFDDYSDAIHPFMYHCHFSNHEDGGMMGQFVVKSTTSTSEAPKTGPEFTLFPNPADERLYVAFADPTTQAYYIRISNSLGRTIYMLPRPNLVNGLDVSTLTPGVYILELTDEATKTTVAKQFVKG
jgi:bilirubin oxidase